MQTTFYDSLIDDFGIWQHTDGHDILKSEGYALDDAARGFLASAALKRTSQMDALFGYLQRSYHDGALYGFAKPDRSLFNFPSSEDAFGQTIWALGTAIQHRFRAAESETLLGQLRAHIEGLQVWRGKAYALLGAIKYDQTLADTLAQDLLRLCRTDDATWPWPDQSMTYAIGILPYSLLVYAKHTDHAEAGARGLEILAFAESVCRTYGRPEPIGNDGWYTHHNKTVPRFSQQPIEPAYMIWANTAAGLLTTDSKYYDAADEWFEWYNGQNPTGQSMIDPHTGSCYDGIDPEGANKHSGAEANICYILARWVHENRQTF